MDRLREPRASDCFRFLNSESFSDYAEEFKSAYRAACYKVGLSPDSRKDWPIVWEKVGYFCQEFWDRLPSNSSIRHGAFFQLCDFAEDWCFGDHGV